MAEIATVLTHIEPEKLDVLKEILKAIQADTAHNSLIPFADLTRVHFARFVIIDDDTHPRLIFSCVHDGTFDEFLTDLLQIAAVGVDEVWGRCEGYAAGGLNGFRTYAKAAYIPVEAGFKAYPKETVKEIHAAMQLRDRLQEVFDSPAVERLVPYLPGTGRGSARPNLGGGLLASAIGLITLAALFLVGR
jgi:hypothetical protein